MAPALAGAVVTVLAAIDHVAVPRRLIVVHAGSALVAALGCVVGFIVAAFIIRRVSTVEQQQESFGDSIVFL
ncbi:MAG TPA: hypothetical protein VH188_12905 [Chthoniobacterales bacterium]|jgi:uncharacterized membrane protein YedE/YeeE|nr:hypothetical protein [Chthoniobacterales bacterium]